MSCETKEQIIETALELFSQNGFLGTSMNDIASQLDLERAKKYEMPETEQKKFAEAYIHIPTEKIRKYSIAQFRHWTEENFSAKFRKMLTLEQFRSKEMSDLYQNYLGTGPLEYMTKIFKKMTKSKPKARQLVLEFYGPIFILYSVYDGAEENAKKSVFVQLENHIKNFIERLEKERAEK